MLGLQVARSYGFEAEELGKERGLGGGFDRLRDEVVVFVVGRAYGLKAGSLLGCAGGACRIGAGAGAAAGAMAMSRASRS